MGFVKRYFHVSQEMNSDPELWSFTSEFGERSLRTWLQVLVYLDKSGNEWRVIGDWLGTLSRTVRQSATSVRRQIAWMVSSGWLRVRETSSDGSPLVFEAPNWSKYHKIKGLSFGCDTNVRSATLPTIPSHPPSPIHPLPTPEDRNEEKMSPSVSVMSTKRPPKEVTLKKTSGTWDAYASAYHTRYAAVPVRNAKVNGILSRLVDRLGEAEAPQVAAFYLTHNKPYYVSSRHSTDLLLRDAEGLRTEWITGVKATSSESRNAERRDDSIEQIKRVKAMIGGL